MTFNRLSRISQDQSVVPNRSSLWYLTALGTLWWLASFWIQGCKQTWISWDWVYILPLCSFIESDDIFYSVSLFFLHLWYFAWYLRSLWSSKWSKSRKENRVAVLLLILLGGPDYSDSSDSYLSTPSRNASSKPSWAEWHFECSRGSPWTYLCRWVIPKVLLDGVEVKVAHNCPWAVSLWYIWQTMLSLTTLETQQNNQLQGLNSVGSVLRNC